MHVLPLQKGILYGPVHSRRLGRSLGINLLPTTCKLCSFDCIYCHYERTQIKALHAEGVSFPAVAEILQAVEGALQGSLELSYLTFSGNGEPTLHPRFAEIAAEVRRLRDKLRPEVRLALLSNSSTVHLSHVREALAMVDVPILKLDAGDRRTFAGINRPALDVGLEGIIAGLKGIPGLVIQSLLVDGKVSNVCGEPYQAWLSALADIRPSLMQIYSTDRPVPETGIEKVGPVMLQRIAMDVEAGTGCRVQAYWA